MADTSTGDRQWTARFSAFVFVVITVIFLARPLLGLGSLLPVDLVEGAAPWRADVDVAQAPHNPLLSDTLDVHTHFASVADDIRSGSASWWDRSVGGGIPTLKAGFGPLLWLYLLVPAWYAPGLVAAARTLVAAALAYGFLREMRAGRAAATVGGIAYCLSGFMVGWAGWPQSNVAAFLPGLFWMMERLIRRPSVGRAAPLALVVAAMVVSNFPVVTAYGLLAVAGYTLWRLWTDDSSRLRSVSERLGAVVRPAAVAAWGLLLAGLLSSLHILAFGEYFSWADTSARERIVPDTSIGGEYLVSVLFPRPFGADHTGHAFWGEGQNYVETQSYAGLAVIVLAVVALATRTARHGATGDGAARGSAVRALWAIVILGGWITYVGGPLTEAVQSLPLLGQNSVGRARVVVNLALALLSGLGLQAWLDARQESPSVDLRRGLRAALVGGGVLVVITVPLWWSWVDGARDRGLVTETMSSLVVPLAVGAAMVALLWRFRPGDGAGRGSYWFALGAVVLVAAELLVFAWPVATVVDRDRADLTTPAHGAVAAVLEPGERFGGDARTFFANTAQVTEIDDMRGHLLTPAGWRDIYRAIDPEHFRAPGSVTNPWFRNVDLQSVALDRLAVGVWAADPAVPIAGSRTPGSIASSAVSIHGDDEPVAGVADMVVPEGGLRALTVGVEGAASGVLGAEVTIGGERYRGAVQFAVSPPREGVIDIAIVGVDAAAGTPITAEFFLVSAEPLSLGAAGDAVVFGTVAADDGLALVRAGDVVLYARPTAQAARLVFAVEEDDARVRSTVHLGELGEAVGVVPVGSVTEMPGSVPAGASGTAEVTIADGGTVTVEVTTSERALVVISQPHYPGWRATVDGRAAAIIETDGAFPGVVVEPGTHTITLDYEPSDLSIAIVLTLLGVVGVVASWRLGRPRLRRGAGSVAG